MSEITQRMVDTRFDDTDYKRKINARAKLKGWATVPYPEVEIEADHPFLMPLIDSLVRECVSDIAEIAEVSETNANALITRSLARIHFAK